MGNNQYIMDQPIKGTKEEQELYFECDKHYQMSTEDLGRRIVDFDKKDELFRSYIDESKWPYRSLVVDPRTFTALYEKTARILANKPRGRMIPREGGDVLKAKINNEILSFQWDENERADATPMLAKWALMDLAARKYGASFGLCNWHWQRQQRKKDEKQKIFFDGPNFRPWNNRDVLHNPSYSVIKNWIGLRDYVTIAELQNVNDVARGKPIYKNLDILQDSIRKEKELSGDLRETNYVVKNLTLKGLTDYLGHDESNKVIEVVTEYRPDRWITYCPKRGVIIRDIPNPYNHGQIPVVQLKYYPIDDDIYGLSEIEPIEKLQKAINALLCQYLDAINMSLYAPLKVKKTGGAVQMHTLEFGPGKKWLMDNPQTDVITHDQNLTGVQEFTSTYRFLVSAMQEALGETSQGISNLVPGGEDKTATEVKDLAMSRSARDNFNQMFLAEALKKQMMFWHSMNQQFLFSNPAEKVKIIRIVGKDAIKYFESQGLGASGLSDQSIESLTSPEMEGIDIQPEELMEPIYGVDTQEGRVPKFQMDEGGGMGKLLVEPDDLSGEYDYIPDVGSMNSQANTDEIKAKALAIEQLTKGGVAQMLMQEGKTVKLSDMIVDYWEDIGFKNADQYIENAQVNPLGQTGGMYGGQVNPTGAGVPQGGPQGMANGQNGGMAGGIQAPVNGQAQPVIPRPV